MQAVKKVKAAILGHDNCRIADLEHMLGFTHTGLIGKLHRIMFDLYSLYFFFQNLSIPFTINMPARATITGTQPHRAFLIVKADCILDHLGCLLELH